MAAPTASCATSSPASASCAPVETDLAGIDTPSLPRTKVLYIERPQPHRAPPSIHKAIRFAKNTISSRSSTNTFATPVLQQPLSLGYDMVVHSATKGLAGHSESCAGAVAATRHGMDQVQHMVIISAARWIRSAFLLSRGIKSSPYALKRQANAIAFAKIWRNIRKSRASTILARVASRSQTGQAPNARLRLDARLRFENGLAAARKFCDSVRLFLLAASLGGVESLLSSIYSSHYSMNTPNSKKPTSLGNGPCLGSPRRPS